MSTWFKRVRGQRGSGRIGHTALVVFLAGGLLGGAPATPAAAAEDWQLPTRTDVTGIKVKPVTHTVRPSWTADKREVTDADLPAALPSGTQVVSLASQGASARAKAGSLPVYVTPVAAAGAGHPSSGARVATQPVRSVRIAMAPAGASGLTLRVSRADGIRQAAQATITVDYRGFARAYGGDWASRLQVLRLSDGRPVESVNDRAAGTITTTASLAGTGAATAFVLAAAASGPDGDYTATSLSSASTWQVSKQNGSFSWAYPIEVPDAPGGAAPKLSLSYSSQSADGRTSGTNSQGSWIGDGWDMWPGYIERTYRGCTDDRDEKEKPDPNNKNVGGGDMCWYNDNGSMSLNGASTELVKVASSYSGISDPNVLYRGVDDDGSRIEQLKDGRDNGDVDGTYWRVTTTDGTQYFFGRAKGQGGSSADTATDSVWSVPVYGNHSGEPGYDKEFTKSRKQRAWRWNLDHVVDPSGNTMTYFYDKEGGAYAREGDESLRTTYDRGGYLKRIEYGSRTDAAASVRPAARVVLDAVDRCVGTGCVVDGKPVARKFPDTPWDQYCAEAPCKAALAPTFFTQKRLSKITTEVYSGSGSAYTPVDSWTLQHTYLMAGVNEGLPMWLKSIQHSGLVTSAGGTAQTDPAVIFNPTAEYMPNRVHSAGDGRSSLFRNRISAITTEAGAQIGVTYSAAQCTAATLPKEHSNTKRCFPQYYGAEGEKPTLDWFHKYVVDRIDVYDNTGGFEHQQTNYRYLDTPAWAYDDSELVKPKKRTWSQYRGYGRVEVRTGTEDSVQTSTEYRYFRGMDGDKQPKTDTERPPTGTPRAVQVEDSLGGKLADHPALAGQLREEIVRNGVDGPWQGGKLITPVATGPTATAGSLRAYQTHIETHRGRTRLSDGSTRWTKTVSKVNSDNMVVEVNDFGDEADPNDDRCSQNEFARNEDKWILTAIKRSESLGVNCDATDVQRPRDVTSDIRTYFDNDQTWGAAPTRGLPVRVEAMTSYSGSTPQYAPLNRTGYDALGRVTSTTDALNKRSEMAFLPVSGGPVTQTTARNPLGHTTVTTLNPALGKPTKVVAGTAITETTYDGNGRVLAVWAPGRSKAAKPKEPTVSFAYKVRNDTASAITTKTLTPYGNGVYQTSVALLDGMLRTRQTQTQTPGGGRAIVDTVHNSRGLVDWSSGAYVDIDNVPPDTTLVTANNRPEIPSLTRNVYDGANRITDVILIERGDELWRTHTDHAGERMTVTPPAGASVTMSITDGRGRQAELRQYKDRAQAGSDDPATFERTRFGFDDRDALSQVTDPGGNTWRYEYDQLGRRIVEHDPDRGTSRLGYDAAGRLTSAKDGRGQILAYAYDDLGRKTAMFADSLDGRKLADWTYDTLTNGLGRLTSSTRYEYDAAGKAQAWTRKVDGYDVAGNESGSTLTVPAGEPGLCASGSLDPCAYSIGYKYRPNGALDQVVHPAIGGLKAETVTGLYNNVGLPNGLIGEMVGGNQIYAQEIVYNQLGQMIGQNLGEHGRRVALTYGFDEATGRRTSFNAVPELKPEIYDLSYKYSEAGSIEAIKDSPDEGQPGETQCFGYDHLQRMTDAWTPASGDCDAAPATGGLGGPAAYWRSYTFDSAGNRRTEVVHGATDTTRTYDYPASGGSAGTKPHAVTRLTGPVNQQFAYDESGNMLCRPSAAGANECAADGTAKAGSQQLTWNQEGRLQKVKDAAGESTYVYDADGNRVLRREAGAATLYLQDGTELRKPANGAATATRYYTHGGSTIAVRTPEGVKWLVSDHQGTASASVTNDDSLAVTRRRSLPFGEVRGTQPAVWTGDRGFVGGTKDSSGLTHMQAREYDPALGRFISVDPLIDLLDPQQWNGYDYANNSPVTSADPSGMKFCSDDYCGPGADWVDSTGEYHEEPGHNDGCGGCSGTVDPTYVKPPPSPSSPAKGNSPPPEQKRNKCSGWDMWCKSKKAASATWEWTKEHKADIAGVVVGVVVGVTCTAITGGAGALACGALAGAVGSFVKSRVAGDDWKTTALMTGTGALFGFAGGALGAGAGGLVKAALAKGIQSSAVGAGLRGGVVAAKKVFLNSRNLGKVASPKAVAKFFRLSGENIAREARELGKGGQAVAIGKDLYRAAMSPDKGMAPSVVGGATPGDWGDLMDYKFRPENMLGPMLSAGFS